jgi:hypothetical protein
VLPSLNGELKRYGSKSERSAQIRKYTARVGNTRKEYSKQKEVHNNNNNNNNNNNIANFDSNI